MRISEALFILKNNSPKLQQIQALITLPYFTQLNFICANQYSQSLASQYAKHNKQISFNKGDIIYRSQDKPNASYMVISGSVLLFSCKTEQAKSELIKSGKKFQFVQQKISDLIKMSGFSQEEINQQLIDQFYDERGIPLFNKFHLVKQGQYFGFAQMIQMARRPFCAVAYEKTVCSLIDRQTFDSYFKQYEITKQNFIIKQLNNNLQKQDRQSAMRLFKYLTPFSLLKSCKFQQILHRQDDLVTEVYMILKGELSFTKQIYLQIPKHYYEKNLRIRDNRSMEVKVAVSLPSQFVGEQQLIVNRRNRTYTLNCINQNTLLIKIESGVFLRMLNQKYDCLKGISKKGKLKIQVKQNKYNQVKNKVQSTFYKQFQILEDHIKDKMVQGIVKDQKKQKIQIEQNSEPELGQYYRDSFEKIIILGRKNQRSIKGVANNLKIENHSVQKKNYSINIESQQKKLMNSNKKVNTGQMLQNYLNQKLNQDENKLRKSRLRLLMSQQGKKINKIEGPELRIQPEALKKVFIKSGQYRRALSERNKSTRTSNRFEEHFEKVISETITRKNKLTAILDSNKLRDLIIQNYRDVIKSYIPNPKMNQDIKLFKTSSIQQMKRSISVANNRSPQKKLEIKSGPKTSHQQLREKFDCVIAPSHIKRDSKISNNNYEYLTQSHSSEMKYNQRSNKLVLLNHMMKPITYNS